MSRIRTLVGTAVVAGTLLALPTPIMAKGSTAVIRSGDCSTTADWKLKVSREDTGLQVEFEVDSTRNGQVWRVKLYDNGILRSNVLKTTKAPSGSFTHRKIVRNMAGSDRITARAVNTTTGQSCIAKLTY
jgi:hypothetical protein